MSEALRLFILAGEASGDRIGADLVARLRQRVTLELTGVGGDELAGQGLTSIFPMSDLAVMGITDVLLNLPRLLIRLEQAARAILSAQPDVVVLIDAQDFSRLLAQKLRARGFGGTLILYVAPSVWARHPERAPRLKPLFDAVLAVLPFEPEVMARLGGPTTSYVGHPALVDAGPPGKNIPDSGPVVLLPGSRNGELRRHLPLLRDVSMSLAHRPEIEGFVLPTLPALADRLKQETANWPVPVDVVTGRAEREPLYERALCALCVSGTITLELALARVPMVVVYALDGHQARVYERLERPAVSLPNIIVGRSLVPEMVSRTLAAPAVAGAMQALLGDKEARQNQVLAFGELYEMMRDGVPPFGRLDPADEVLAIWRRRQRVPIGS